MKADPDLPLGSPVTFRVLRSIPENEAKILFEWSPTIFGVSDHELKCRGADFHVIGYVESAPVTHVGLLTQNIAVGSTTVLIGGVGGVVTVPEGQGQGYAKKCLQEAAVYMKSKLGVSFGFLFCQPRLVKFYESAGWQKIEADVFVDQPTGKVKVPYCSMVQELLEHWPQGTVTIEGLPW